MFTVSECCEIINNLPVGFFRTEPQGRILVANRVLAEMFGYQSSQEIVQSTRHIGKELYFDEKKREALIRTLIEKGHVKNFEALMKRKDGTTFWAAMNVRVVQKDNCTPYFEGTMIDVTEKKILEERLKNEQRRIRNLIEHAPIGMAVIDRDRRYAYVNPSFVRMFGYDLSDVPDRKTWCEKAYPDENYRSYIESEWEKDLTILDKGEYKEKTIVVTCKDGSRKTVRVYGVALGGQTYLMCYEDLTTIEEMETRYKLIFENSKVGIFQVSGDWRLIIANPFAVESLGYSSFEEMARSINDLGKELFANEEDKRKIANILKKEGEVKGYEVEFVRKDGSTMWVSLDIWAIYDRKGDFLYYQGVGHDITEEKKRKAELEALQRQLIHAQKMEAVGTFAGGMAHDFNNILTIILGNATLLGTRVGIESPDRRYLDQIISACHTAADLIKSLLTFSRKHPVRFEPIEVNLEIKQMRSLLRRLIPENINLDIVPFHRPLHVICDRNQLRQVFFNLTSNAKDAMPDGGTITIEVKELTMGEDFIKQHGFGSPGRYALISFKDTGTGIEDEILPKIFEPFFTTKDPGRGTGLGLATVYGIVKRHNGYITVESKKRSGTVFYIYLPLSNAEDRAVDILTESSTSHMGKGEKILLVEDNNDIRNLIRESLETANYKVKDAKDGEEALSLIERENMFDLIITDMVMPKKTGKDLYLNVREKGESTPFIFISGYGGEVIPQILMDDKYCHFLHKPVSIESLLKKVREVLDRISD